LLAPLSTLVLVTLLPFLAFAEVNKSRHVDYLALGGYALIVAVLALAAVCLLKVVFRRSALSRLANSVAAFLFAFFSFDVFSTALSTLVPITNTWAIVGAWAVAAALVVAAAWRWSGHPQVSLVLFVAVLAMAAVPAGKLLAFEVALRNQQQSAAGETATGAALQERPNIYMFLLDGYARADRLKELFEFDNSPFLDFLKRRGFYVVERATANYPTTWLSVASTMQMRYVQTEDMPPYTSVAPLHKVMKGENAVVQALRRHGYKYVYVANGHQYYDCPGLEQLCIEGPHSRPLLGDMEINLLKSTPVHSVVMKLRPGLIVRPFLRSLTQVSEVADSIATIQLKPPLYVYAHLLVPHPPFILDAECKPTGQTNISLKGWNELPMSGYTDYLQCVNRQIGELVARIVAKEKDAIIIIQGDHGTSFFMNWKAALKDWPRKGVLERLSPLNAIRLPERCAGTLYPTMSLVNTFRVVFACLEGRQPDLLPDISYISPDSDSREFGHVLRIDVNSE
jgi:hypothetical protein